MFILYKAILSVFVELQTILFQRIKKQRKTSNFNKRYIYWNFVVGRSFQGHPGILGKWKGW